MAPIYFYQYTKLYSGGGYAGTQKGTLLFPPLLDVADFPSFSSYFRKTKSILLERN